MRDDVRTVDGSHGGSSLGFEVSSYVEVWGRSGASFARSTPSD